MVNQKEGFSENKSKYNIERRPALQSDTELARQIHHKAYHDVIVRQFGVWDDELQDKFFDENWASGKFDIILCDGKPCGYYWVDSTEESIIAHELVILPEYQGKGIGTKLINNIIEEANSKNIPIKIGALKENYALELYKRLGFKEVDSSDTHIGLEYNPK